MTCIGRENSCACDACFADRENDKLRARCERAESNGTSLAIRLRCAEDSRDAIIARAERAEAEVARLSAWQALFVGYDSVDDAIVDLEHLNVRNFVLKYQATMAAECELMAEVARLTRERDDLAARVRQIDYQEIDALIVERDEMRAALVERCAAHDAYDAIPDDSPDDEIEAAEVRCEEANAAVDALGRRLRDGGSR